MYELMEKELFRMMLRLHFLGGFAMASLLFLLLLGLYLFCKRTEEKLDQELEELIGGDELNGPQ